MLNKFTTTRLFFLIFITYSFFSTVNASSDQQNPCPSNPPTIQCFKIFFSEIYHTNYDLFWDSYYTYMKDAEQCDSLSNTAIFLDIAPYIKGNTEVSEAFHEFSDKLFLSKPECYLDSALLLSEASLNWLVRFYLSNSFTGEDDKMEKVIQSYRKTKKYQDIIKLYDKYHKK